IFPRKTGRVPIKALWGNGRVSVKWCLFYPDSLWHHGSGGGAVFHPSTIGLGGEHEDSGAHCIGDRFDVSHGGSGLFTGMSVVHNYQKVLASSRARRWTIQSECT